MHLLADGRSTVRVGVEGLARDVSYAPRARSQVTGRLVKVTARAEIPVNVRPTTTTVLIGYTNADWSFAGATSICLDEGTGIPCESGQAWGVKSAHGGVGSRSSTATAIFLYPGFVSNGEHTASYTLAASGMHRGLWAFALSLN